MAALTKYSALFLCICRMDIHHGVVRLSTMLASSPLWSSKLNNLCWRRPVKKQMVCANRSFVNFQHHFVCSLCTFRYFIEQFFSSVFLFDFFDHFIIIACLRFYRFCPTCCMIIIDDFCLRADVNAVTAEVTQAQNQEQRMFDGNFSVFSAVLLFTIEFNINWLTLIISLFNVYYLSCFNLIRK